MEFLNDVLKDPKVQLALAGLVSAALSAVTVYLREVAVRLAARDGAVHAEVRARETGSRGEEKMDSAVAHVHNTLPMIVRPRDSRMRRLIEGTLEGVRKSMPPTNGAAN